MSPNKLGLIEPGQSGGTREVLEVEVLAEADTPMQRAVRAVPNARVHVPTVLDDGPDRVYPFTARGGKSLAEAMRVRTTCPCCEVSIDRTWNDIVEGDLRACTERAACLLSGPDVARLPAALGDRSRLESLEVAHGGTIFTVMTADRDSKKEILARLDSTDFDDLAVDHVAVSPTNPADGFDGTEATESLVETLKTAVRMGYYESPRGCTMDEIAATLGITKSAVYHRMSKLEEMAVGRLYDDLIRNGTGDPRGNGAPHVE